MSTEDTPTPSTPFQVVSDYLDERGFKYTAYPEHNRISHSVWGENTLYRNEISISQDGTLFQAYLYYPIAVRNEKFRASANELLTRANFGLPIGNFEFDIQEGVVRFHVSLPIGSFPLEKDVVARLLRAAVNASDRYFPALIQHLYAGITPEDAIYTAEIDQHAANVTETPRTPTRESETSTEESSNTNPKAD